MACSRGSFPIVQVRCNNPVSKISKTAITIIVLAVVIGGGRLLFYGDGASSSPEESAAQRGGPIAVEVTPVRQGIVRDLRTFTGTLISQSQFEVAPKIGGRLERLAVNIGDPVERNQLVAELDDDEFVQQVEEARAELQVAQANLEEARTATQVTQREYERVQTLRQQRIASESELDRTRAQFLAQQAKVKVAQAQVAQRQAALKTAEVRLSYTRVRASWQNGDGLRVVGERFVDEGTMLAANTSIISVLDLDPLIAVVFAAERDYARLRIGQPAMITVDALPRRSFPAEIVRLAPLLREASRQARVEIRVPNPESVLHPGMFARAQVELDREDEAVIVPIAAIVRQNERQGVFIADLEQKTAHFVEVELGITEGEQAQIIAPALSGHVVTLGQHLLDDGAAINVSEPTAGDRRLSSAAR